MQLHMPITFIVGFATLFFISHGILTSATSASPHIGFVLDHIDRWTLKVQGKPYDDLFIGKALPAGGEVESKHRPSKLAPNANITIVLLNGDMVRCRKRGKAVYCSCEARSEGCPQPLKLPVSLTPETSWFSRITQAAFSLFTQHPTRYIIAMSRGGSTPEQEKTGILRDAVARLDDQGIDLSPVFASASAGTYCVSLRLIEPVPQAQETLSQKTFTFHWQKTSPAQLHIDGLKLGLFQVDLWNCSDERTDSQGHAWLLAVRPDRFTAVQNKFARAQGMTTHWEKGDHIDQAATQVAIRSFLRVYLDMLAREEQRTPRGP